jgi:excisionase family DNA binding protein
MTDEQPSPLRATADDVDRLMTVEDVAALLQVPPSWVYSRTRRRGLEKLPFVRIGKYVRFEPAAIRAFVARQRTSA